MLPHLTSFLHRLEQVTSVIPELQDDGWIARCPAHQGAERDLAVQLTERGVISLACAAGCTPLDVTSALGLPFKSLYTEEMIAQINSSLQLLVKDQESPASSGEMPLALLERAQPVITRLDECPETHLQWLWPERIPLGKLTLLVGDPGLGKSFVTLDVAARVSRGNDFPRLDDESPAGPTEAGSVVLLSAEDDVADTIRPRLMAAGADLKRIVALGAVRTMKSNSESTFSLSDDLDVLEHVLRSLENCRLVVIDPISAYLGGTDAYRNADIRSLLAPLASLAARTGVAVVAVSHLNKMRRGPAIYRSMDSLAFTAMARSVLAVLQDLREPTDRTLISLKNNVTAPADGYRFRLKSAADDGVAGPRVPVVEWSTERVQLTADDILHAASQDAGFAPATDEAIEWLRASLAVGSRPAVNLKSDAKRDGIEPRTLARAKARLGVVAFRQGFGVGGSWHWRLPGTNSAAAIETNPEDDVERVLETIRAPFS